MRSLLVRVSAGFIALAGVWVAYTQTQQAPAPLSIQKVKGDLYMIGMAQGVGGGNIAVYPTNEGVILVDDMFDRDYTNILEKVKSVSDKPIKYVLNSHHHDDHAGGNAKMSHPPPTSTWGKPRTFRMKSRSASAFLL